MTIIDKVDLAALRKADAVCFDHNIQRYPGADRASFIRAIKRANVTTADPFAQDVTHSIEIESRAHVYGNDAGYVHGVELTGFSHIGSAQYHARWQTIAALLRAGDDVKLVWIGNNNSPILTDAGLFHDYLDIEVRRGKTTMVFRVDDSVCRNNSAKMLRPLTYSLA